DNIAFLTTPLVLFHKKTKEELHLSSAEWAIHHSSIGKEGIYSEYEIGFDDIDGTFRCFRHIDLSEIERQNGKKQTFVEDILLALKNLDSLWKGPSWDCFYHAVFNQRPISVITARGHSAETIRAGIYELVKAGWLPAEPNYLSIFAVSNKQTRISVGDHDFKQSTAELKQHAIRASVEKAIEVYGYSPHHRFGMSDDDPKNIQLIVEEMTRLKGKYPEMSFFMIETHNGSFTKHEISQQGLKTPYLHDGSVQLDLFSQLTRQKA
ncbi:MAG: hypothetical protein H7Z71_04220, partial [Moraxellaceae bacterium]|nr:hypothetical protein [Pseudobdellovibrionaceae bacterium]